MARPPTGPNLINRLNGSAGAKHRALVILETIAGTCSVEEGALALNCNTAYLHRLRDQLLDGMIAAAEPRTPGRKPAPPPTRDEQAAVLAVAQRRATDAEVALELERCRVELALVLGPRVKKNKRRR
ncbi:MAG: hypothetical protein RLZZ494_987 [Pseudomonadota bacterium]|jgi:hypothetical protein